MNSLKNFFNNFDMSVSVRDFNNLFNNDKANFNIVKDIILNNSKYKEFILNILYDSNLDYLFDNLTRDEVEELLNVFDNIYASKKPLIISKLRFIPKSISDKILKYSSYDSMNIDDCLFIYNKKVHDRNDICDCISCLLNFSISTIKKILDNNLIDFNFSFEEVVTKIKERKGRFVKDYFDKDNIGRIKDFRDSFKYYILLNLDYNIDFINSKDFVDIISSIDDISYYRKLMYKLESVIDTNYIDRIRGKYIRNNINKIDDYNLTNYIIDYLFGDFYKNVVIDIGEMINYRYSSIIDKDHIKFYKMILDFNKFSKEKKLEIFDKFKFLDIKGMFYDDMRRVKDDSYSDLMDNNFILDGTKKDKRLSRKYGVDVYRLDGEKFFMLVRCSKSSFTRDEIDCKGNYDGYSFSFINDKNISTFSNPNFCVCCLYDSVDPKYIVHVSHTDSYSEYDRVKNMYASSYCNEIKDNESLMNDTVWYNEVVIDKDANLCAKALIVLDNVYPSNLEDAKRLNLPILIINSKKYEKKEYRGTVNSGHYVRGV